MGSDHRRARLEKAVRESMTDSGLLSLRKDYYGAVEAGRDVENDPNYFDVAMKMARAQQKLCNDFTIQGGTTREWDEIVVPMLNPIPS